MEPTFTCEQCGHGQTFDPPDWPRRLVFQPGRRGGTVRLFYRLVRCAECGREQKVLVGRE